MAGGDLAQVKAKIEIMTDQGTGARKYQRLTHHLGKLCCRYQFLGGDVGLSAGKSFELLRLLFCGGEGGYWTGPSN